MVCQEFKTYFCSENNLAMNDFKETSTLNRMQERYWTTKQAVFKKLGKKADDCITASDAELDAKIELFQTIEDSFLTLMRVLENYQDRLCALAQEENAMGRFLKENGKYDKTRAGKVMTGAGKAMSFSAQQKLSLRLPLVRLYHEVETFQYRAIVDTLHTVEKMEKARTAYRGALMWMKDVSQQLDPDTGKQLEKFRKVQSNVRKSKLRFDKLKLDTLQKVDLLSFSRCNLFSQALAAYQNTIISISEKLAHTMMSVAETTKGYQHYDFYFLKELTETSKKLADETSSLNENSECGDQNPLVPSEDKDVLLFFESEYFDEDKSDGTKLNKCAELSQSESENKENGKKKEQEKSTDSTEESDSQLININIGNEEALKQPSSALCPSNNNHVQQISEGFSFGSSDLLTGLQEDRADKSDVELLKEILESNLNFSFSNIVDSSQDQSESSSQNLSGGTNKILSPFANNSQKSCYLPSQLLDMGKGLSGDISNASSTVACASSKTMESDCEDKNKKGKQDMSTWYNLFADLDPFSNPDFIGKKPAEEMDC
ncbi:hypothetical protein JTE90_012372 [Oedothorax gibbosus]|uniref:AH domain-containing protein n=1 Tax=Oedothorax gibbosus TaxID=931172 RepID=A0AAV6URL1_9ARAC|nr:hypothetical protein JTE90_012372 [Oedothorax gibbosus]